MPENTDPSLAMRGSGRILEHSNSSQSPSLVYTKTKDVQSSPSINSEETDSLKTEAHRTTVVDRSEPGVDIAEGFSSLNLKDYILQDKLPEEDTCLAHLKFLFALENMKHDMGYTDGLFGLWDLMAFSKKDRERYQRSTNGEELNEEFTLEDESQRNLSLLREKRWAIFIIRAVDRYESWWQSMKKLIDGTGHHDHLSAMKCIRRGTRVLGSSTPTFL